MIGHQPVIILIFNFVLQPVAWYTQRLCIPALPSQYAALGPPLLVHITFSFVQNTTQKTIDQDDPSPFVRYYTQKNFFTTLSIIQENFNYKIKYSQDYLVNKLILYQFEDIVTILRILFHQIDIKFSCIQEKPTSTLSYGYFFSECD